MTELQEKVLKEVKKRIENERWYRGVCTNNFPSDVEIINGGFINAVDRVVAETMYWDFC